MIDKTAELPELNTQELVDTASALVDGDKGLLAMDESNSTCDKRSMGRIGCVLDPRPSTGVMSSSVRSSHIHYRSPGTSLEIERLLHTELVEMSLPRPPVSTPSNASVWKWRFRLGADPKRWMKVMAAHWPLTVRNCGKLTDNGTLRGQSPAGRQPDPGATGVAALR